MLNNLLQTLLPFVDAARAQLMIDSFLPMVEAGAKVSAKLAVVSFVCGLVIATIVALARVMPEGGVLHRIVLGVFRVYISIIRGTPMLVQLAVVFYALPALNVYIDPIPAAIIAFSLNVGAYSSETIRAAILSVPKGQWEAGFSIGMGYLQTFRRIIAPQAMRVAVPPLSNSFIGLFKETSLASFVTVTELFRVAQQYGNQSYDFLPVYIEAGFVYWLFCLVLFIAQSRLEKYFDRHVAK